MSGRTTLLCLWFTCAAQTAVATPEVAARPAGPHEYLPADAPAPPVAQPAGMRSAPQVARGIFVSTQVNVGTNGLNIVGDAANEPSIAIDPTDPQRMAIGWRQFDNIASNFRQAGAAYSRDGGRTWTASEPLDAGVFRSDPVLDVDAAGVFYYYSLMSDYTCQLFKSLDGGATWSAPFNAYGGDKAWMAIDRTGGAGHGNLYFAWDQFGCCGDDWFTRSTDGGETFASPIPIPEHPIWGAIAIGTNGEVFVAGRRESTNTRFVVARSSTIADPQAPLAFDFATDVALDGRHMYAPGWGPNPGGLMGQVWIAVDHSTGPTRGNVYLLSSVNNIDLVADPLDVHFARSTDGGQTWSAPVRVNQEPPEWGAWQWFGTLSVAPTGRIDVIFNDTRNFAPAMTSELHYTFSTDAGETWMPSIPISPPFDPLVGYPNQNKLGDYYDMISDARGADIAYAATFNGEQDVYHLRIDHTDCNSNGVSDLTDIAGATADDCNNNSVVDACELSAGSSMDVDGNERPDECDPDCNANGFPDGHDLAGGGSFDCNLNGVPDECESLGGGDYNGDGSTDIADLAGLLTCLAGPGSTPDSLSPQCIALCVEALDMDGDGDIDLRDFAGVQRAFVPD